MKRDICFFLPTRKGSQRVKSKNTRPFANHEGGILELKLTQLLDSKTIDTIILSTNDEKSVEVAKSVDKEGRIVIDNRPEHLCLDTTRLGDLISYVPTITKNKHIFWGHTTTPFVAGADYDAAIEAFFGQMAYGYDSLISVLPLQNFLLTGEGKVFNYDAGSNKWPRTQDLPKLYEVNHAMFIASRETYEQTGDRIGSKPYLYEMPKLKSFDIDWEDDFLIAEALYDKFYRL